MKLQIDSIDIRDLKFGPETKVCDHILEIDRRKLEEVILRDDRIKSVEIDIVSPGDRVRVVNIVDVIQPRCKVDREDEDFPGWLGKMRIAGNGRSRSLRGISLVLSNSHTKRPHLSFLDMFGIGAQMSKYGSMKNIILHPVPSENTGERDFESAVKLAGLTTAVYLARSSEGHSIDETEVYELDIPNLARGEKSNLPRVAYYFMVNTSQYDYQGIGDPILYGVQVTDLLPTIIHPNEILDGAVVNIHAAKGLDTYSLQNHAVIKELYKRNGNELNFVGVVIGVGTVEAIQRQRTAMMATNLISNVLGADGVILTKVHGGAGHVDLANVAEACEDLGIKTTLFIHLWHSGGSLSDDVLFSSDCLNAIVNVGQVMERVCLPQAEKILGGTTETTIYNPDFQQKAGDESIDAMETSIVGVFDHVGSAKIAVGEY